MLSVLVVTCPALTVARFVEITLNPSCIVSGIVKGQPPFGYISAETQQHSSLRCRLLFGITLDEVWRTGNDLIFNNGSHFSQAIILRAVLFRARSTVDAHFRSERLLPWNPISSSCDRHWKQILPPGFFALHCDASVSDD